MKPHRNYVSAGRIAALWDEHPYWTKRMLWEYVAKGRQPDTGDNPRARSGRKLEAGVLEMAAEDLQCEVIALPQAKPDFIQHPTIPIGCLADGLVRHPERGLGIISAKTVSWTGWARQWMPMKNGVPRSAELQLQAELLTLAESPAFTDQYGDAPSWGCIAALNDLDVHLFEREAERDLHLTMQNTLDEFFKSITDNNPPSLQYVASELPLIGELFPWGGSKTSILDLNDPELLEIFGENVELLMEAKDRKKSAEADIDEAKAHLLELSDGNTLVRGIGYQCKVNRVHVRASHCKNCGAETRKASDQVRYTPKEI